MLLIGSIPPCLQEPSHCMKVCRESFRLQKQGLEAACCTNKADLPHLQLRWHHHLLGGCLLRG